jgi:hypothetical protein
MRMKRTRQVLVLTLVATALCADRVVTAAPALRAQLSPTADPIARLASHLGGKLSGAFRRVVPAVRLSYSSREATSAAPRPAVPPALLRPVLHLVQGSPFQFRLPPPTF